MFTEKLVEVTRGSLIESMHRGVVAVVDISGSLIASVGDPSYVTYLRSAAKPMQALPVVESGAAAYYNLSQKELALIMASHSGQDEHVRIGMDIMEKLGLSADALKCGTHFPLHKKSSVKLVQEGKSPSVFHCTCSGKHAGMLALVKYHHWEEEGYYLPEHPVQKLMLATVRSFAGLREGEIIVGVDGCGVSVFGMPLYRMALAYARWAKPDDCSAERAQACRTLHEAMLNNPVIIAGAGRLATEIMNITGDKLLVKDGNEGIICVGVPGKGWGIAVKIEDGDMRALGPVIISVLQELGLLTEEESEMLKPYARKKIKNYRGETIGEIRSAFSLIRSS